MEPILIISNLVLVGLTGTYAWLSNKSTKQLKQESVYYRQIIEKQLKFSALPHLYWDLRPVTTPAKQIDSDSPFEDNRLNDSWPNDNRPNSRPQENAFRASASAQPTIGAMPAATDSFGASLNQQTTRQQNQSIPNQPLPENAVTQQSAPPETTLSLEVFNISNVPAYDVHISVIGAYTEEGLGIATFMRSHVQPRHRKYPLQSDKVGYYGVRNALRLSLLPTQQKIVLSLPFPLQPIDVYTLVQYRELSGQNYYQVCCFSAIDESGAYRANILEPSNVQTIERLHLFDIEDFTPPETAENKEDIPYYLADFIDLWNHSISSRLMLKASAAVEENVPAKTPYEF